MSTGISLGCTEIRQVAPVDNTQQIDKKPVVAIPGTDVWLPWSEGLLDRATELDRPLLIYFTTPGWKEIQLNDRESLQSVLQENYVATKVNPFYRPDVVRRFSTSGWPAAVLALPDGRPYATAVDIPDENLKLYLLRQARNYAEKRQMIEAKLRSVPTISSGSNVTWTAHDVFETMTMEFDSLYGGFGTTSPKYLNAQVMLFLANYSGDRNASAMMHRSLEAILASPMNDSSKGGVYAFSYTPDWRAPGPEQDLSDQAALLRTLLVLGKEHAAHQILETMQSGFFDDDMGVFYGRRVWQDQGEWFVDPAIYTARNAAAIRACVAAFNQLGDENAMQMARRAMNYLLLHHETGDKKFYHHSNVDEGADLVVLADQPKVGLALFDLSEVDPTVPWRDRAWDIAEQLKGEWELTTTTTTTTAELLWRLGEHQAAATMLEQNADGQPSLDVCARHGIALVTMGKFGP